MSENYAHKLSGGQAGTAPLNEVVGGQCLADQTVQLEDGYGGDHYGLGSGDQCAAGKQHGRQGDDHCLVLTLCNFGSCEICVGMRGREVCA